MSWSVTISAETDIKEEDIDDIVENFPENLSRKEAYTQIGLKNKQDWGWSCATDIKKPKGKKITISGAGFSRHLSRDMVSYIKKELREKGYENVHNTKRFD